MQCSRLSSRTRRSRRRSTQSSTPNWRGRRRTSCPRPDLQLEVARAGRPLIPRVIHFHLRGLAMSNVHEMRRAAEALNGPPGSQSPDDPGLRRLLQWLACYWRVELLLGVFSLVIAVVVFAGVRRHPRLRVPADRDYLDVPGIGRAGLQQPLVARPDQRHPDGRTGVLGERPVLPHARGHAARVRSRLGAGEGHHRHRAGVPVPPARLKLTESRDLAAPRRDPRRVSTAELRR